MDDGTLLLIFYREYGKRSKMNFQLCASTKVLSLWLLMLSMEDKMTYDDLFLEDVFLASGPRFTIYCIYESYPSAPLALATRHHLAKGSTDDVNNLSSFFPTDTRVQYHLLPITYDLYISNCSIPQNVTCYIYS
jgi:hypothetical protein